METANRVGEVGRTSLGSLKRVCEEFSLTTLLSGKLEKYHTLWKASADKYKQSVRGENQVDKDNENKSLFPDGTFDLLQEIQEQRGEGTELTR